MMADVSSVKESLGDCFALSYIGTRGQFRCKFKGYFKLSFITQKWASRNKFRGLLCIFHNSIRG